MALAKDKRNGPFIIKVSELIEVLRAFKRRTMGNPKIPFPWPPYVSKPEQLDEAIAYLEKVYEARTNPEAQTCGELGRARKGTKIIFSQLVRYVALTLDGRVDIAPWPGFDLSRRPGETSCRKISRHRKV